MGAIVVVYVIVIIFPSLGVNWAFLALLPLLLPLLLVIATSRVIWKSFTENPWFQQAKMPWALVWQIRGCASEQRGVEEKGSGATLRSSSARISRWPKLQNIYLCV